MAEVKEEPILAKQKLLLKKLTVNVTRLPGLTAAVYLGASSRNLVDEDDGETKAPGKPSPSVVLSSSSAAASSPSSSSSSSPRVPPVVVAAKEIKVPCDPKHSSLPSSAKPTRMATIRREVTKKPSSGLRELLRSSDGRVSSTQFGRYPRSYEHENVPSKLKGNFFAPLPVKSSFRIPKKCDQRSPIKCEKSSRRREYDDRIRERRQHDVGPRSRNDGERPISNRYSKSHGYKSYGSSSSRPHREGRESSVSKLSDDYIQYVVGSVSSVEKWLHDNPIGAKPNSAGEVPFVKQPKKVERVTNFVKGHVKVSLDEPVPMSVDTKELVSGILQFRGQMDRESDTICGQLTQLRSQMKEEPMSVDEVDVPIVSFQKKIYVVLDTNVLASDLYTVDEIMKSWSGENDTFQVVLVVPWVVLQELDGLKDDRRNLNPKLRETASKAVRYLHAQFTNCHPQVKGQAVDETSEVSGLTIESNDDRVLQCCLFYQQKGVGKVILFSNDRNLCSKAIVNGIRALTKERIKFELDRMAPIPREIGKPRTQVQGVCYERILREFKTALFVVLEAILKQEMEAAYEELWLKVILIKPPWTDINDLLKCFVKHWIAVFGLVVKRSAKTHLDTMVQSFRLIKESNNYDSLKSLMTETLQFLTYFEPRQAYLSKLRPAIETIRGLLSQLKGVLLMNSQRPQQRPAGQQRTQKRPVEKWATEDVPPMANARVMPDETPPMMDEGEESVPLDPLVTVQNKFQNVWSSINHICGSLYDSFGIPNPISYSRPSTLPLPAESFHFIPRFYPVITDIRDHIRSILQSAVDIGPHEEDFLKLCYKLEHYFVILNLDSESKMKEELSPEMLHFFCTTAEKRDLLGRGLVQLEECCAYIFRLILMIKDFSV